MWLGCPYGGTHRDWIAFDDEQQAESWNLLHETGLIWRSGSPDEVENIYAHRQRIEEERRLGLAFVATVASIARTALGLAP